MKKAILILSILIIGLFLIGCTTPQPQITPKPPIVTGLLSFKSLDDSQSTLEGVNNLVLANNKFAIDYYNKLDSNPKHLGKNIFFSPFSISTALAMTYEGANGQTAKEIRDVFYFPQNDILRQSSFAKIYNTLNENASKGNYNLSIANSLWNEKTYEFKPSFYDTINNYYYGTSTPVDFKNSPEEQRQLINNWVLDQTNQKIEELLPKDSIDIDTRLVLTNAIYFKGTWLNEFKKENTILSKFFSSKENTINTLMMNQTNEFNYYNDSNFQYLELPYKGEDISMIVILPKSIYFECLNETQSQNCGEQIQYNFIIPIAEQLSNLNNKLNKTKVNVSLPKFKFTTDYKMSDDLKEMGILQAFTDFADFFKMDSRKEVKISEVYHKAFVEVNEEGTEAAAATGVVMIKTTSVQPTEIIEFNANHPFAFIIKDNINEEILFIGKIIDPAK